jgi:hypothetical protein
LPGHEGGWGDRLLPVSANTDRVNDLDYSRSTKCDRFRHVALESRINQTIQIHDVITGLHHRFQMLNVVDIVPRFAFVPSARQPQKSRRD